MGSWLTAFTGCAEYAEPDEAGHQRSFGHGGSERVLRARFNDARFFWEFDSACAFGGAEVELLEYL